MSNISCSIKLDGGSSEISRLILEALMPEVERYLRKVFDKIQIDIRNIIMEAIVAAPEYSSLLSGTDYNDVLGSSAAVLVTEKG